MQTEAMVDTLWSDWIKGKFEDFKRNRGGDERGALVEFARLFSAPHQVVAAWMRVGANPPRKPDYISRMVELYGKEAYEALGMPVPGDSNNNTLNENRALELLREVPAQHQEEVLDLIELYLLKHGFRRIDGGGG